MKWRPLGETQHVRSQLTELGTFTSSAQEQPHQQSGVGGGTQGPAPLHKLHTDSGNHCLQLCAQR